MWLCSKVFKERSTWEKPTRSMTDRALLRDAQARALLWTGMSRWCPRGERSLNQGMEPKGLEESLRFPRGSWEDTEALI